MTADHVWARRVIEKVRPYVGDPRAMRALGFCVSIEHARFMAGQFAEAGIAAAAVWGDSRLSASGEPHSTSSVTARFRRVFSVDLFNEGVDVRDVDTLLLLRPTDSPVLFIQQLGRGLRKVDGKVCTVLDFVGNHRKEFRFDRRFRALLGGSRSELQRQIELGFPFLPAGCHLELEPVAQDIVLRSLRDAIPSDWRSRCEELAALGDVDLRTFLEESGLELEDIYASNRSWSALRRAVGLPTEPAGPAEDALASRGRPAAACRRPGTDRCVPIVPRRTEAAGSRRHSPSPRRRLLRMLHRLDLERPRSLPASTMGSSRSGRIRRSGPSWTSCSRFFPDRVGSPHPVIGLENVPLRLHARYTRTEILAAFGVGDRATPPEWREGVRWDEGSRSDVFAFTLDKSDGNFSPTTRYRDYAISPTLIHWESQSTTSLASAIGQRYINHVHDGTNVVLFARLRTSDRAFWCLGPASYCQPRRRTSDRVRVGAPSSTARGSLYVVRRSCGLSRCPASVIASGSAFDSAPA